MFKAGLFDFDGTLTEKGEFQPPAELAAALVSLAKKMPIAFCTGRQLESFEAHGLNLLMEEIEESERLAFLGNICLIAENGSVGYFYNLEKMEFEEFYRGVWPEEFIARDELKRLLTEEIRDIGTVYDAHRVVVVMRSELYGSDNIEGIYALSQEIFDRADALLRKFSSDYEKHLHLGNAGIGVLVCPADSDKDFGIKMFAEYLRRGRGLELAEPYREIFAIGDSPAAGGNDHYFLSGRYGTPFNVGLEEKENLALNDVLAADGGRLKHSQATLKFVQGLL